MDEGATSQGIQAGTRSWKDKEMDSPLTEGTSTASILTLVKLISDFWLPEL